ncbi:MAG: peptidoglycan DD-metalloendopeptidase family protein, partial [Gammaproteobacteria bacterium]
MHRRLRFIPVYVLPLLLAGCGSPVKAPVSTRDNQSAPAATSVPRSAASARRTPAGGKQTYYVVQRGDTLYSIAWAHGLSYQQLAASNGIRYPYTIYTGQRLDLQAAGTEAAPAPVRENTARTRPVPQAAPVPAATPLPAPAAVPSTPAAAPAVATTSMVRYDGHWVWPTRGRLLRSYQSSGRGKKGIDIGGHDGQPVKAAANGKVVYAGSGLVGYGRLIIIKHNENLLSAYGHNSKLLVAEGDQVRAG